MNLKKIDIAKNISSQGSIPYSLSKDILDSFIDLIKSKSSDEAVKISGFGTFVKKITPQRIGRNPATGKEHIIPARMKLNFMASKKIKEQLN